MNSDFRFGDIPPRACAFVCMFVYVCVCWATYAKDIYRIDWKQRNSFGTRPLQMLIYSEEFNLAHSWIGRWPAAGRGAFYPTSDIPIASPSTLWTQEYIKSGSGLLTFAQVRLDGFTSSFK